jgi:NADPH:quinone reductase-like Zn-dependent oxidoreductase
MRAVRIHSTGGPEVLQLEEAPTPEPGRNELLIRLRAAAVCRADVLLREGRIPIGKSMPHILGVDGAGAVVRGTGGDARPGDRVFVSGDVLGRLRDGTYAEFIVVPSSLAFPMPRDMRYEDAAALGMTAYAAWQALVDRAAIQPGQWVVVHAAGSGVGVAAIQIAKLLGAKVIATAGADAKLDQARQLGADFGINYSRANFATQVRHMTNNRGVDVILDTVGGDTFRRSIECLAMGGRLITVGTVGGSAVDVDLQYLISRGISVIALNACALPPYQAADRFRQIYDLVAHGRLHAVIDRVLSLSDAPLAHKLLATRSHFGKIVLRT